MTIPRQPNSDNNSFLAAVVALVLSIGMLPGTVQAISACKTEDGRTVYSQACLEEMQRKRQQAEKAATTSSSAKSDRPAAPTNQPTTPQSQATAASAAIVPSPVPTPSQGTDKVAPTKPQSTQDTASARRQLVKPAVTSVDTGQSVSPKPVAKASVAKPADRTLGKPVQTADQKSASTALNKRPLKPKVQAQQIPAKLTNKPLMAPLATPLGNPMQAESLSGTGAKPGCKFTTLVEQVRTGTSDALLACAPSLEQLNQQDARPDVEGRTLLHWAVDSGQLDMARHLLLQGADSQLPARADKGGRAIHLAAKRGHNELIKLLGEQPGGLEATDYFKRTPLFWAIEAKQVEAAMQLLAAGANPNAQDRIGKSVLMVAVSRNLPSLVAQLLRAGADPSQTNFKGQTVMHLAATDSPATIQLLLQQGISLEALNQEGQTPLLYAASRDPKRYWRTIRTLVNAGAKLDVEDLNEHTLLDYSLAHNHLQLFDLLLDQGLDSDNLRVEQLKGKRAFLQRLLDRGLL